MEEDKRRKINIWNCCLFFSSFDDRNSRVSFFKIRNRFWDDGLGVREFSISIVLVYDDYGRCITLQILQIL